MKRILICIENLNCGGVEKCLIELLNNIDYKKYKVDLLLINEIGNLIKNVNENVNIKYIIPQKKIKNHIINRFYKSAKTRLYRNFPILINYELRNENYDIEIAYMHGFVTRFIGSIRSNAKKIAWVHTDVRKCKVAQMTKLEKYLPKFNEIICVSNGVKSSIDEMYPNVKSKTRVIYNIIDRNKIIELSMEKINYKFKKNTIAGVGRFYQVKRFDLLIKAQKLLKDEKIESNLILVGYGDLESEYKDLIKKLGLEDCVDIIGYKENPYPYINNADIFALSSDHEGLPTVICEAMSLGKPIISTKCSGAVELIGNNEYGILTSCNSEYELKDALKLVLENENIKMNMSKKSLERFDKFDTKMILKEIETIFE